MTKISCNGGYLVQDAMGRWFLTLDDATRARIEQRTRRQLSNLIVVSGFRCGPTPIIATLGGFYDKRKPGAMAYCQPEGIPELYHKGWRGW